MVDLSEACRAVPIIRLDTRWQRVLVQEEATAPYYVRMARSSTTSGTIPDGWALQLRVGGDSGGIT